MRGRPLLLAIALLALAPASALAGPPPGDWTYIRKDAFRHYACKQPGKGGTFRVRAASWVNGSQDAVDQGIGQYAAIARDSNRNLVSKRTSDDWAGGYIQTVLKNARADDRVWIQGAYYGPTEPWSDGFRVGRLTRCAIQ
jgi:hypothetical protein